MDDCISLHSQGCDLDGYLELSESSYLSGSTAASPINEAHVISSSNFESFYTQDLCVSSTPTISVSSSVVHEMNLVRDLPESLGDTSPDMFPFTSPTHFNRFQECNIRDQNSSIPTYIRDLFDAYRRVDFPETTPDAKIYTKESIMKDLKKITRFPGTVSDSNRSFASCGKLIFKECVLRN